MQMERGAPKDNKMREAPMGQAAQECPTRKHIISGQGGREQEKLGAKMATIIKDETEHDSQTRGPSCARTEAP